MFGIFKRRRKVQEPLVRGSPPPKGMFNPIWERKRLPGPGAMNYAYEGLSLAAQSPIGPGVRTRTPIIPFAQIPTEAPHMVTLAGLPTVSGQLVKAPLYDPDNGGYGPPLIGTPPMPFPHYDIAPAGMGSLA